MLFRKARAQPGERPQQGPLRPRPAFCISLTWPLPALGRAAEVPGGAGTAMLHLAFCSAGASLQGSGWPATGSAAPDKFRTGERTGDGGRRLPLGWVGAALASGAGGWPSRAWFLPDAEASGTGASSGRGLARNSRGGRQHRPGEEGAQAPDSFTLAMQEWPIPLIAWSGRQAAFVGIMHFCDVLPGLPRPRRRSLRSRLSSADPRPPQIMRPAGVESTVCKCPR